MKGKTLHVVNYSTVSDIVKDGLILGEYDDEVTCQPVDFSTGYLPKDFSDKELCFALQSHLFYNDFKFREIFDELKGFVSEDFSVYDKVIVWHGWSADDLLLLYLMSTLTDKNLYHIDIKDCKRFVEKYQIPYPSMSMVSSYDIARFNMVSLKKKVSEDEQLYYIKQWYRWVYSKFPFRFSDYNTGLIKGYDEAFMDYDIIETCLSKTRLFHVITAVYLRLYSKLHISNWDFIVKRILKLWHEHHLDLYTDSINVRVNRL